MSLNNSTNALTTAQMVIKCLHVTITTFHEQRFRLCFIFTSLSGDYPRLPLYELDPMLDYNEFEYLSIRLKLLVNTTIKVLDHGSIQKGDHSPFCFDLLTCIPVVPLGQDTKEPDDPHGDSFCFIIS